MSPKLSPSDEQNTSQLLRDLESAYAEHHLNGDGEQGDRSGVANAMYEGNSGGKKDGFGFGAKDTQGYLEVDSTQAK